MPVLDNENKPSASMKRPTSATTNRLPHKADSPPVFSANLLALALFGAMEATPFAYPKLIAIGARLSLNNLSIESEDTEAILAHLKRVGAPMDSEKISAESTVEMAKKLGREPQLYDALAGFALEERFRFFLGGRYGQCAATDYLRQRKTSWPNSTGSSWALPAESHLERYFDALPFIEWEEEWRKPVIRAIYGSSFLKPSEWKAAFRSGNERSGDYLIPRFILDCIADYAASGERGSLKTALDADRNRIEVKLRTKRKSDAKDMRHR